MVSREHEASRESCSTLARVTESTYGVITRERTLARVTESTTLRWSNSLIQLDTSTWLGVGLGVG